MQVVVRLRVDDPDPKSPHLSSCVSYDPPTGIILNDTSVASGGISRSFHVDSFMPSSYKNEDVFDQVCKPSIDRAISTGAADTLCFLAYGHTNSGKTHTIAGAGGAEHNFGPAQPSEDSSRVGEEGLLTLTASYLLQRFGALDVSMLEVYGEQVFDMLARGHQRRVRRVASASKGGAPILVVENLSTRRVFTENDWSAAAECGWAFRKTSPMDLNARSSRSHAIFTLKTSTGLSVCLVDLAGSERQSIFTKQLNKQSIAINKSLSRLSTVIQSLGSRRTIAGKDGEATRDHGRYVNFRDTTLTVLLQRYLTGNSLTTFIACVHPNVFFFSESLSTLRYTARLHNISTEGPPPSLPPPSFSSRRGGSRQGSVESAFSSWTNDMADRLQAEVISLRQQLAASSQANVEREELYHQKLSQLEMERQNMILSGGGANRSVVEVNLSAASVCSAGSSKSANDQLGSIGRGSRDTKRVASWLLSRVASALPQFTVMFDDYFHDALPRDITCIGYVTCMACLLPRDPADSSMRLGILDAGDLVMALTMLDAGIPPFVTLHEPGCRETGCWEAFDLADGVRAYALAMFDVHTEQVDSLCIQEEGGEECMGRTQSPSVLSSSACCDTFSSYDSLVPFAIVFAVDAVAPLHHHEALYHHLETLQLHQNAIQNDLDAFSGAVGEPGAITLGQGTAPPCETSRTWNEPLATWGASSCPSGNSPFSEPRFHGDDSAVDRAEQRNSHHARDHLSVLDVVLEQIYEQSQHQQVDDASSSSGWEDEGASAQGSVTDVTVHRAPSALLAIDTWTLSQGHPTTSRPPCVPRPLLTRTSESPSRQVPHHESRLGFVSESPRRQMCTIPQSPQSPQWEDEFERTAVGDHSIVFVASGSASPSAAVEERYDHQHHEEDLPIFTFSTSPSADREANVPLMTPKASDSEVCVNLASAERSSSGREGVASVGPSQGSTASRSTTPVQELAQPFSSVEVLKGMPDSTDCDAGQRTRTPEPVEAVVHQASLAMELTPVGPQRSHALWKAKRRGWTDTPAKRALPFTTDSSCTASSGKASSNKRQAADVSDTPICQACTLM